MHVEVRGVGRVRYLVGDHVGVVEMMRFIFERVWILTNRRYAHGEGYFKVLDHLPSEFGRLNVIIIRIVAYYTLTILLDSHGHLIERSELKLDIDSCSGKLLDVDPEVVWFAAFYSSLEAIRVFMLRLQYHLTVFLDALG